MATATTCSCCGALLVPGALGNRCARCLMGFGLADSAAGDEPRPAAVALGRRFGDYELLEEIGRGGMGVVYRARQISLGRIVAIKMLVARPFGTPELEERLRLEAEAAGGLSHPNIVTIHEFGEHEGQFYFAMEYVEGQSLAQLTRHHSLPPAQAARYLKAIAEAIHYAHEHGIIHRDLKPSNLLVDAQDRIRVTDFGLAKRLGTDSDLTFSGQLVGSPNYLSPEQAAGRHRDLTPRSDVYSLGAVLYQLLTGRPPLIGASLPETLQRIREKEVASPRLLNPRLPHDLETICLKCLQKQPAGRYGTAHDLAEDLGRFLGGEPIRARPISAAARAWRWCRRKPALAGLGATVLLLLLAITMGAAISAAWFRQQARETRDALWKSYLDDARLSRASGQQGQRFRTLETLAKAAALRPSVEPRNEAIAALTVPDVRRLPEIRLPSDGGFAFDATLSTYAQCVTSRPVVIRRTVDGRELARLPIVHIAGSGVLLSASGRYLAICIPQPDNPSVCQVWDVGRTSEVSRVTVSRGAFPMDFSPDERRVAFGQPDDRLALWDLAGGRLAATYRIGLSADRLAFHPAGKRLAALASGQPWIALVDVETGKVVSRVQLPGEAGVDLDWSADGRYLAVGCREETGAFIVAVWEAPTATWKQVLRGHTKTIIRLNFVEDGHTVLTWSWDGAAQLWCADTGLPLLRFQFNDSFTRHHLRTHRLAFQIEWQGREVHELVTEHECRLLRGHSGEDDPWSADFSPDGRLLASAGADGVRLWDAQRGKELGVLSVGACRSVRFDPRDGSLVAAVEGRVLRVPLSAAGSDGILAAGPPSTLATTKVNARSSRFSLSLDGSTLAWVASPTTAEVRRNLTSLVQEPGQDRRASFPVGEVAGGKAAAGDQRLIGAEEAQGGRMVSPVVLDHGHPVAMVALSPKGQWTITGGERFRVWSSMEGKPLAELPAPGGYSQAAFSPDGRWLALGTHFGHRLVAVGSWRTVAELKTQPPTASPVAAFTRDGRLVALAISPYALRLLATGSWAEIATFEHPARNPIVWIALSPDDTRLAVACGTHVIQLWDLRAVRQQLAAIGLDWDSPPYPRAPSPEATEPRLIVESEAQRQPPTLHQHPPRGLDH